MNQFWTEIFPLLRSKSNTDIYVIAGDVGGNPGVISAFYQRQDNVHLIASGMGHAEDENYLKISVSPDDVDIKVVPLNESRSIKDIRHFDVDSLTKRYGN